ncbi:hypothetical protein RDABS01_012347 [Bienertia sinuspersici]
MVARKQVQVKKSRMLWPSMAQRGAV